MDLQTILQDYQDRFLARQATCLSQDCKGRHSLPRSCGHRSCNQCQHQSTQQWLERQSQKLLPVQYYLATFTLPYELRSLAKANPRVVYAQLMQSAKVTLQRFGLNKKGFEAELGLCAVLHTHTRRLDYHPHVHIVVPAGGIHRARREWRKITGDYLFNGRALARAFRGECLNRLSAQGLDLPKTPKQWIVQCQHVGKGQQALEYLSRYLYRGVISNRNILEDDGTHVTFRYQDSQTHTWKTRTLPGEAFIALVMQHVLPKGFRRSRDYGFLHGNAKKQLQLVQWNLHVSRPEVDKRQPAAFTCPSCRGRMHVTGFRSPRASPA